MVSVFISYASKDSETARKLYAALTQANVKAFLADLSISPGKKWTEEIFNNLREAKWVFFLASKASCSSAAVLQELGATQVGNKNLIPVLLDIEPEELPVWVNTHQAIDPKKSPELLYSTIETVARSIQADRFLTGIILGVLATLLFVSLRD